MIPTISTIPLLQLASGDRLSLQVYRFVGAHPGKKAYLQSNLHGAEISGNAVLQQLIEFLMGLQAEQLTGEIWLVPVCNPVSVATRSHHFSTGRYNVSDGKDWNRIFWDYEKVGEEIETFASSQVHLDTATIVANYRHLIRQSFDQELAKIDSPESVPYGDRYRCALQSLCLDADYVIDLHSSSNQALDYLYCFHDREASAKAFLLDWGILMQDHQYDGDTFDEAFLKPWLALEKSLAKLGKPLIFDLESWTLELGSGMQINPDSVVRGLQGIKNYLASKEFFAVDGFPLDETASHPMILTPKPQIKRYYTPAGGMIQSRVSLGSFVKPGDLLYQMLNFNKSGDLPSILEVKSEFDALVFDVSTNQSLNQGEYILSLRVDTKTPT